MKERKRIGEVFVDSGLIWVGDPCVFWPKEGDTSSLQERIGTRQQFCNRIQETPYPHHYNFSGLGVAVTSGYGDGIYPIWATIEDEVITSVTIELVSDEDENEDEDSEEENEQG
jgi:hypothetical protein